MQDLNQVHHGDWMSNDLPDKSVQLIIADPPYFEVKGEFDFIWPSFDAYLADVDKWAQECKRVLAENGTLFWWGMDRKIAYAQVILDKYFNLLGTPVWEKPSIANEWDTRRTFPERAQERLLMYGDDVYNLTQCVYSIRDYIRAEIKRARGKIILKEVNEALGTATNGGGVASACLSLDKAEPAMFTKEMYKKMQVWLNSGKEYEYLRKEYEYLRKEYEELRKEYEELRRPFNNFMNLTDVLRFSRDFTKHDHDTKKPEKLTRALILTCSRPNDLVLVPFSGSGTECAMSAKEGRPFIGYDVEKKYVDMSNKRARVHLQSPTLF